MWETLQAAQCLRVSFDVVWHTLVYDYIQPLTRHSLFIQNTELFQPSAPVGWISLRSLCWYEQWVTGKEKKRGGLCLPQCVCVRLLVCVCITCSRPTSVRVWLQYEEFMKQSLYQQLFTSRGHRTKGLFQTRLWKRGLGRILWRCVAEGKHVLQYHYSGAVHSALAPKKDAQSDTTRRLLLSFVLAAEIWGKCCCEGNARNNYKDCRESQIRIILNQRNQVIFHRTTSPTRLSFRGNVDSLHLKSYFDRFGHCSYRNTVLMQKTTQVVRLKDFIQDANMVLYLNCRETRS